MTTLSIRFQTQPLWLISRCQTLNLPVTVNSLTPPNPNDIPDFKSWILANKDLYSITHILDENWLENGQDHLYDIDNPMPVLEYLNS